MTNYSLFKLLWVQLFFLPTLSFFLLEGSEGLAEDDDQRRSRFDREEGNLQGRVPEGHRASDASKVGRHPFFLSLSLSRSLSPASISLFWGFQ